MNLLKYILKNINLLNILLISAIFLLADYGLMPMLSITKFSVPAPKKAIEKEEEVRPAVVSPTDPLVMIEQNLFHPERRIPPEKKADVLPVPKPEFVLYGTTVTKDMSLAYMEDKNSPSATPRGRRHLTLKKGDSLSGYVIKEIDADRVVMEKEDERIVVYIYDSQKTRSADTTTQQPQQAQPPSQVVPGQPARRQPVRPPVAPTRPLQKSEMPPIMQ